MLESPSGEAFEVVALKAKATFQVEHEVAQRSYAPDLPQDGALPLERLVLTQLDSDGRRRNLWSLPAWCIHGRPLRGQPEQYYAATPPARCNVRVREPGRLAILPTLARVEAHPRCGRGATAQGGAGRQCRDIR